MHKRQLQILITGRSIFYPGELFKSQNQIPTLFDVHISHSLCDHLPLHHPSRSFRHLIQQPPVESPFYVWLCSILSWVEVLPMISYLIGERELPQSTEITCAENPLNANGVRQTYGKSLNARLA